MHLNFESIVATFILGSTLFLSNLISFVDARYPAVNIDNPDNLPDKRNLRSRTKEARKLVIRSSIEEDAIPNKWIVALKKESNKVHYNTNLKGESVQSAEQLNGLVSSYGGKMDRVFHNAMYGMEVTMTEADAARMSEDPNVDYVEQDSVVRATQQSPATWGIDRVDQRDLPLNNSFQPRTDGTGVTAYVIDTGVQIAHNDFKDSSGQSRATWGINTSGDSQNQDCNGHGTHVASTLGGLEYGVAKNVDIVAVKVLQCNGSGTWAGVIAGVEWAMNHAANNGISNKSVANMSLGGGFSQSVNTAVKNLHESGVLTAVAAGNSNANACNQSPASEPAAITVGSTTSTDARSSFSNYGTCLDIFAPGSSITAAWIGSNSATNTISGTSMASPHVAGGLAIAIAEGSTNPEDTVINTATMNKVIDPRSGSPNKLLYVGNVESGDLDEFDFFPYKDSGGNDIGKFSGGVESYATECFNNPECKGFNSNGWLKHTLKPQSDWSTWTNDPSKGFYVKKGAPPPTAAPTSSPSNTPTSSNLDEFDFFPYKDSGGNDIGKFSGGVESYATECFNNPECKGFNSNGWLKHTLKPQSDWSTWTNDPSKGFYVKKDDTAPEDVLSIPRLRGHK